MDRKNFLQLSSTGLATAAFSSQSHAASSKKKICIFTKPFQHMSYEELAQTVAEVGADGVELPCRPGGHITPEQTKDELPKLNATLQQKQLEISILASGINSVDSPHAEATLRAAKAIGIKQYRMSYYKYDLNQSIPKQLNEIKAKLKDLAAMNRDIGIQAIYQNHSGKNYFGAPLWDVHQVFQAFDTKDLALAFDIGHATIEGGKSWPIQYQLLKPIIQSLYIKDPQFDQARFGWKPLGEGLVQSSFFKMAKKDALPGPYSLHVEYLSHKNKAHLPLFAGAFKRDIQKLRSWI